MATRIYLPSSGAPAVTPSTWNHANQAGTTYTIGAVRTKGSTAMTSRTTASGTTSPYTRAVMRYVIGPIYAVQISGTVNAVLMASEAATGANATMSIAVKIITPAGADRAVLLAATASDSATATYEFTTTLSSRRAYDVTEQRPIPLTAQTPTDGDYLVIEIGFRSATTTTRNVVLRHGDNSASDLADGQGATDDYAAWVEFSSDIAFAKPIAISDAGTGADAIASILRRANIIDSGAGVDTGSVKALLGISDTGAGADTPQVREKLATISDAGSGTDAPSVKVPAYVFDSGAGAEALAVLARIAIADTAAGADAPQVRKKLATIADTGAGADAVAVSQGVTSKAVQDAGAGADALAGIKVLALVQDAGGGLEALAVRARFTATDVGAGADAVATAQKTLVFIADAGAGADQVAGILARAGIQDLGQGVDVVVVFKGSTPKFIQDAGLGADYVFVDPIGAPFFAFIFDADARERILGLRPRARIADADPRERTLNLRARGRILDVAPRDRENDQTRRP